MMVGLLVPKRHPTSEYGTLSLTKESASLA
jgi:hypothetical protein